MIQTLVRPISNFTSDRSSNSRRLCQLLGSGRTLADFLDANHFTPLTSDTWRPEEQWELPLTQVQALLKL